MAYETLIETAKIAAQAVIPAVIRSVGGWIENAFEDNKVSPYEWSQLGSTIFRVGLLSLASIGIFGAFVDDHTAQIWAGAGSAFIADWLYSKLSKTTKKRK